MTQPAAMRSIGPEPSQAVAGTRATWILPKQFGNHDTLSLSPPVAAEFVAAARRLADNEDNDSPVVSLAAWGSNQC